MTDFAKISSLDLYLFGEGKNEEIWKMLGAQVIRDNNGELAGVRFSVWAPNAREVALIHDGNGWNRESEKLKRVSDNGVWSIFIPGVGPGERYKFSICGPSGQWVDHADPYARQTEEPPLTASIVYESRYQFADQEWQAEKNQSASWKAPVSIYEVHLGSWRPGLNYRTFAESFIKYNEKMNFTHIEFLPLTEHPYGPSWGYQVTSFYAPTSRYGSPDDFKFMIDQLHQAGIGVIMDWVPAHFPRDEWALANFDGTALYEHEDPRLGEHPDWGTKIFNYERREVKNFLIGSALYWLTEFQIDGIRVDAVASMLYLDYSREFGEWLPNKYGGNANLGAIEFLQELNTVVYQRVPKVMMIAEESTAWPGVTKAVEHGGLGFGFKWNMGWMHDTLDYFSREPIYRKYHQGEITRSISYAFTENFVLPLSHDEVVHGKGSLISKMPGDRWQALANLRTLFGFMWAHPGKKLLFMGGEFAQSDEWREGSGLWWDLLQYEEHQQLQNYLAHLNTTYRNLPALWELDNSADGFFWIKADDAEKNLYIFGRKAANGDAIIVVENFSPNVYHDFTIPVPDAGEWEVILNSDLYEFGGSGVGSKSFTTYLGENDRYSDQYSDQKQSEQNFINLLIPPLATLWLKSTK